MTVRVVDKCLGQYRDRRCITEQQCRAMRSVFGVVVGEKLQHEQLWKVRDDGVCHVSCPPTNYTDSLTDPHRCNKCADTCHKGNASFCDIQSCSCLDDSASVCCSELWLTRQ